MKSVIAGSIFTLLFIIEFYPIDSKSQTSNTFHPIQITHTNPDFSYNKIQKLKNRQLRQKENIFQMLQFQY